MKESADRRFKKKAFTLLELMISTAVFIITISGILALFIGSSAMNEAKRNMMLAYTAVQSKMEDLKSQPFDAMSSFDGQVFDLSGFPAGEGKGLVNITTVSANLLRIKINGCYLTRNRLIGNSIDNCTSSPVELITQIAR